MKVQWGWNLPPRYKNALYLVALFCCGGSPRFSLGRLAKVRNRRQLLRADTRAAQQRVPVQRREYAALEGVGKARGLCAVVERERLRGLSGVVKLGEHAVRRRHQQRARR